MNIEQAKQILIKYYKEQLEKMLLRHYPVKYMNFLKVKFRHSFECYYIGRDIVENDEILKNKSQSFKEKLELAYLLHDIGRFFELSNELAGKTHGVFGADLLKNNEDLNDKIVLIAIRHHDIAEVNLENDDDYITLSDKEKQDALEILLALRDADKISNLYLFQRENTIYTRKEKRFGFSEEYFDGLKDKYLIDKKYKNTIFDSIAYYIIWYHELIFQASKNFVIEHKLIDHLLKMFEFYIDEVSKNESKYMKKEELQENRIKMENYLSRIKNILREQKIIK